MIRFLILVAAAFLILSVVAVRGVALRRTALVLLGILVLAFLGGLAVLRLQDPVMSDPNLPIQNDAAIQRRRFQEQELDRSKTLVPASEVEVQTIQLMTFGSPVGEIPSFMKSIDGVGLSAMVRNGAAGYALTALDLRADIFDCPAGVTDPEKCDPVGTVRATVTGDVPPDGLREMKSSAPWQTLANLPPVHGRVMLRSAIEAVYAKEAP